MSLVKYNPYNNYNKYSYRSSKSRAYNQFRSAKKGNETLAFVVNSNHVFSARYDSLTESGTACINVWDVLQRNSNFNNLKSMYDQVKIDGIQVKLSVTDAMTSISQLNQVKNITIYTAWDKTGLSRNQYRLYDVNGDEISEMNDDEFEVKGYDVKIGSGIVNNSSAQKSQLNSFQRWNRTLKMYPSLMNEKSQYIQTSNIKRFYKSFNSNTSMYELNDLYDHLCEADIISQPNPVIPFESTDVRFKPCLLVGVFSNGVDSNGQITQYGNTNPVIFNGEFSISCTFKNLKGSS